MNEILKTLANLGFESKYHKHSDQWFVGITPTDWIVVREVKFGVQISRMYYRKSPVSEEKTAMELKVSSKKDLKIFVADFYYLLNLSL